ncbi:MAG: metal/formaldehyde-sensitive transcriptional repressor [bacterium]
MAHTVRDKGRLIKRVRRMQGQVAALERALEDGHGCSDVLQQIAAVRGAANGLMADVMEGHLREHLGAVGRSLTARRQDLAQLAAIVRRYLK